ncbi:MAG: DNA mismatch repair protein MutL, partial [Nitrospirae bacterium]
MGRVKTLPEDVQKAIRAGEVVERPGSVLKELLENAIDAKAKEIRVEVLAAGTGLIKVSDDGEGILTEDLPLCFQRHTTSKISSKEDLFRIHTMGFRGEALYSIASVSKMKITSQAKEEVVGAFIEVHGGRVVAQGPASTVGTTVEVRDLFYNTPARRKFLKSYRTELYHLITVFQETALCHPEVAFNLNVQRQETLVLPVAVSLRERLMQIYGQDLMEGILESSIEGVHL